MAEKKKKKKAVSPSGADLAARAAEEARKFAAEIAAINTINSGLPETAPASQPVQSLVPSVPPVKTPVEMPSISPGEAAALGINPADIPTFGAGGMQNLPMPGGNSGTTGKGAAEALAFGLTDALIKAFPELKPIYDLFVAEKYADARLAYYATDYYKNLGSTASTRQTNKATRPGVYAQEFDAWKQSQKVRLANKGVAITPDIDAMLEQSYLKGDTDLQLDIRILDSGKLGTIAGSTLGLVGQLKNTAYEQGVDTLLGADYWNKVSQGLFAGTTTTADVEEYIKNTAMSAYPAYSEGIKAGRSFNMQTSALRQSIANLLEMDPDTIGNNNPVFKQLTNYINPTTQKPEQIPLWEAEKIVKKRDEWMYTKNARDTFDSLSRAVLRDMGVAY